MVCGFISSFLSTCFSRYGRVIESLYKSLFHEKFRKLKYEGSCRMQIICPVGDYFAFWSSWRYLDNIGEPTATVRVKSESEEVLIRGVLSGFRETPVVFASQSRLFGVSSSVVESVTD